jgi:hypothetical protein
LPDLRENIAALRFRDHFLMRQDLNFGSGRGRTDDAGVVLAQSANFSICAGRIPAV